MNKRTRIGDYENASSIPSQCCIVQDNTPVVIDNKEYFPNRVLLVPTQATALVHVKQISKTLFGSMDKYLSYRMMMSETNNNNNTVLLSSMKATLENPFAVKAYFKQLVMERKTIYGNETEEDAFREIELLRKIAPNEYILCLRGIFEQQESASTAIHEQMFFTLFDYIPLGSLFEYIRDHEKTLTHELGDEIIQKIAMGVSHLHNVAGIVHCDISIENVLMKNASHPVLIDFGMSRELVKNPNGSFSPILPFNRRGKHGYCCCCMN